MSDRESIDFDVLMDEMAYQQAYEGAAKEAALEQCIYLFVEGDSEEVAFPILLQERLGVGLNEYGVVVANYNGLGNLKHTVRLMNQTLSHERPMIFTFDDDDRNRVPNTKRAPENSHFFRIPQNPVVKLPNGDVGGSFEESFSQEQFIDACFETSLLKRNPNVEKRDFKAAFQSDRPFYDQIVKFLQSAGVNDFVPSKVEITENLAISYESVPDTYVALAQLIRELRDAEPIKVKM